MKRLVGLVIVGVVLGVVFGLSKKSDDETKHTPVAPAVPPPSVTAVRPAAPEETARDELRAEVVEGFNVLFHSTGVNATALVSGEDLIVRTSDACDRETLSNLRKAMAAMSLDPARGFATMKCASGFREVALELR